MNSLEYEEIIKEYKPVAGYIGGIICIFLSVKSFENNNILTQISSCTLSGIIGSIITKILFHIFGIFILNLSYYHYLFFLCSIISIFINKYRK